MVRANAAQIAAVRASAELGTLGLRVEVAAENLLAAGAEAVRATKVASRYAADWLAEARANGIRSASEAMSKRLERIAVSESSGAYNGGRHALFKRLPKRRVRLFKVWDAKLDAATCEICAAADGDIVGIAERFRQGTPGDVHPWCRCTDQLLRSEEVGDEMSIKPASAA